MSQYAAASGQPPHHRFYGACFLRGGEEWARVPGASPSPYLDSRVRGRGLFAWDVSAVAPGRGADDRQRRLGVQLVVSNGAPSNLLKGPDDLAVDDLAARLDRVLAGCLVSSRPGGVNGRWPEPWRIDMKRVWPTSPADP